MSSWRWSAARVADPHRARVAVARPVRVLDLRQLGPPVDPVHDLQRPRRPDLPLARAVGEPAHERRGLLGEAEPEQAVERERGVADPRVAVVPVALAADLLGQRGRRRGDERAGRRVGEQLQRERGAVDHLAPAPAVARLLQPAAPVARPSPRTRRRLALRVRAADVVRGHALEHVRVRLARRHLERRAHAGPRRAGAARRQPIVLAIAPSSASESDGARNSTPCGCSSTSWSSRP